MIVSLLGAECTGKSTLCAELGRRFPEAATVDEHLRTWCLAAGRTPRRDEQAGIAAEQQRRIQAAAAQSPLVIADTTALMTAVYSLHYFHDDSLLADALVAQRALGLCFLCSPTGLPWQSAGWLRDGERARAEVHARLLALLNEAGLSYTLLEGSAENRAATAEAVIRHALRPHAPSR